MSAMMYSLVSYNEDERKCVGYVTLLLCTCDPWKDQWNVIWKKGPTYLHLKSYFPDSRLPTCVGNNNTVMPAPGPEYTIFRSSSNFTDNVPYSDFRCYEYLTGMKVLDISVD